MAGSAAFLAPLIATRPSRGRPPVIWNLSMVDTLITESGHRVIGSSGD
jgi:hypothetical protein